MGSQTGERVLMSKPQAAALVALILSQLSGLHLYWAAGGRFFLGQVIPSKRQIITNHSGVEVESEIPLFETGPLSAVVVALFLGGAAWMVAASQALIWSPISPQHLRTAVQALSAIFLLRAMGEFHYLGFFKTVRGTQFALWDSWLYSPLCLVLGSLMFWLSRAN